MKFQPFPKVPRYSRDMTITEKIDGTNASVHVVDELQAEQEAWPMDKAMAGTFKDRRLRFVFAGSRNRFITPDDDNFGFAKWVLNHGTELSEGLGPGSHYGEWWGSGVQRGYGLEQGEKRFSLFNVSRWFDSHTFEQNLDQIEGTNRVSAPTCCHVVPVLFKGPFDTHNIHMTMESLAGCSRAAMGYENPEGVMIYHTAANQLFKKTFEGDAKGKERAVR